MARPGQARPGQAAPSGICREKELGFDNSGPEGEG